jgi:hypothetical protein
MNNLLRFLVLAAIFVPVFCFGSSSAVERDIVNMRSIAQSILLHAAENRDQISIPFSDIPSVRRISEEMESGTLVFTPHEKYIFPFPSGDIVPEIVPVAFFTRDDRVVVAFSDLSAQYFRLSDPPSSHRSNWNWGVFGGWLLLSVSPLLNIILLVVVVLMWRPRMK